MSKVAGVIIPSAGLGNKTWTIGLTATSVRITVGGRSGNDSYFRQSTGYWVKSSGTQHCFSWLANSFSSEPLNKIISLKDSTGAVIYEATVVSTASNQITLNFTQNPGYLIPFYLEADDL